MKALTRIVEVLSVPLLLLMVFFLADRRPGYFSNITYLEGLILLEVVIVTVWHFESALFPVMMLAFFWAGSDMPFTGAGEGARWVFLFVGASVGLLRWLNRDDRLPFHSFHVIALLCVSSAIVSSLVSSRREFSLLKTASLFLLFLYGSCGARLLIAGREKKFFRGLMLGVEWGTYFMGFCYVLLHAAVLGNPNSLGAVAGVILVPLLLWGVLATNDRALKRRWTIALCISGYLLLVSASRSGLLAAAVVAVFMCLSIGRGVLLLRGALIAVFFVAAIAVLQPSNFDSLLQAFTTHVIYKDKVAQGLLGSRMDPWQDTLDVMRANPWFGSGFGTDRTQVTEGSDSMLSTVNGSNHEHGSSYLSVLQYMGLLGVVPFVILLLMTSYQIWRVSRWMRKTRSAQHYAIPLAMVCVAGLVHAGFEDWMFAVGYYLTVFFWTSAFLLCDLQPRFAEAPLMFRRRARYQPAARSQVVVASSR